MSQFLDDSSYATQPGELDLSLEKLRLLEPALLDEQATFTCSAGCPRLHPAAEMRARFAEYLKLGCCGPALVMSLQPLVVAAYAEDLDAVVLLEFPPEHAQGLSVGSRLLSVSTFSEERDRHGKPAYAEDVIPGPNPCERWTNFQPLIADFLCDDDLGIARQKREIDDEAWRTCERAAHRRLKGLKGVKPRSGRPTSAGKPVPKPSNLGQTVMLTLFLALLLGLKAWLGH